MTQTLNKTPLFDLHTELGGKMVDFAGYAMPVQFDGILAEHAHVREAAGLFDVSHMGQAKLHGVGGDDPAAALERLCPSLLKSLKPGSLRYSALLADDGGMLDDLMITRTLEPEGTLYLVVNAACKDQDYDRIEAALGASVALEPMEDHALLALQGPQAADVLASLAPDTGDLSFMQATHVTLEGVVCWVSRSGYTGEDGFEISIPAANAAAFARRLLADGRVKPIGLGARDSLRLEAGLCLSGHDFDAGVDPVEAGISFIIGKRRREEGGFCGEARILRHLARGPGSVRVGLVLDGRQAAREGAEIVDGADRKVGRVTSGSFAPSLGQPVAMGYVPANLAEPGTELGILVRGRRLKATVSAMPFVPHRYKRKA